MPLTQQPRQTGYRQVYNRLFIRVVRRRVIPRLKPRPENCSATTVQGESMAEKEEKPERDKLAESLDDLFANLSTMIKGELQGTNNLLELLEKMNLRVAEEYKGFGDVASGLRVFVEQLKSKSGSFDEYVQQIDAIEQQVTEFEAVISMLDKYVCMLESKVRSACQVPPS